MSSPTADQIRLVGLPPIQPIACEQMQRWRAALAACSRGFRAHYPMDTLTWTMAAQTGKVAIAFYQAFKADFPQMTPHEVACHMRRKPRARLHEWKLLRYGPWWTDGVECFDDTDWKAWLDARVAPSCPVDLRVDQDGATSRYRLSFAFDQEDGFTCFPAATQVAHSVLLDAATAPADGPPKVARL